MTEIAEPWHDTTEAESAAGDASSDGFAGVAGALQEESARLAAVADTFRATARELAEHEQRLRGWGQALDEKQRVLDARSEALDRWKRELDEIAARSEQANARIAEAGEREAALRSLAEEVLNRYRDTPLPGDHN
jgi:chromosome segregation ATPase